MGVLNRLFGSTESIAKEILLDEGLILRAWKSYLETIPKKKAIVDRLRIDTNLQSNLQELKKLLNLDLVDISNEEREESELISDLEAMDHSHKIKRVHRLEQCLRNVETKYEYVYQLLHQLQSFLKSQMHLVSKLLAGSKNAEKLISHIKLQLELELEIIKKIEQIETFHDLFLALVKGEHMVHTMDSREKKLLKRMQNDMNKIFSKEIREGIVYGWAITVFNRVCDIVENDEALMARGFGLHSNVHFEFVNRPEFVDLVRETIQDLKQRTVSEQMINVFIHIFREWYNQAMN